MVERSRFWDGTTLGDATVAPYDAATEFSEVMLAIAGDYQDANKGGVLSPLSLAATQFAANTLRIAAGQAIVWGTWYENDANIDFTIPTPAGSTRIDRIVLRKSWAAQTVRLVRIAGAEGGSAPAMTQTAGTTWDIPIATVSITTGGTMTITDGRQGSSMWYRTANGIRTDSHVGIGVSPSGWPTTWKGLQIGATASIWAVDNSVASFFLSNNSFFDGAVRKALATGVGLEVSMANAQLSVSTAPSVAAGATQTFSERFRVDANGTLYGFPAANTQALNLQPSITTESSAAFLISRTVPSTQYQWLSFQNGAALGDFFIGRRPNSDALTFAVWNGVSLGDRLTLTFGGDVLVPNGGGASMVEGFVYLPSSTAPPTGTPVNRASNRSPMYYDSSANRLWIYSGAAGGWKFVQLS